MIDKVNITKILATRLEKLPVGHCLDLRTYKRNRSVLFIKKSPKELHVIQNGFDQQEFDLELARLPKAMKTILKKEFPRSTKVRLYDLGKYDPETMSKDKRKVI